MIQAKVIAMDVVLIEQVQNTLKVAPTVFADGSDTGLKEKEESGIPKICKLLKQLGRW